MILSMDETRVISTLGWVDGGAVWVCETATTQIRRVPLSDARYLAIHPGARDVFAAVHHFDGARLDLTVHRATAPVPEVARIAIAGDRAAFRGDAEVWRSLPRCYAGWYGPAGAEAFCLFIVDARRREVEIQRLDWHERLFDPQRQGIIGVAEVPGSPHVLISVQRDSQPLLYDPRSRTVVRRISLAGRVGNPVVRFRARAPELWATDYDVLLRLDARDWSITNAVRLAGLPAGGGPAARQYIGDFAFNHDESLCVVARPFEGDVVALNTESFSVTHRAVTGGRPLDVALLHDRRVFARDWQTGELLRETRETPGA
jgi:hypothetical protein